MVSKNKDFPEKKIKFHCLTGKAPVSEYQKLSLTGKHLPIKKKEYQIQPLTRKTPVEVKMNGWSFLLLTGTLPVSV